MPPTIEERLPSVRFRTDSSLEFDQELDPIREATMTEPSKASPASTKTPQSTTDDVLRRVQGEFLEMPGLRLTEAQACRLWGLDAAMCSALLSVLIDARFLFRTRDGAVMRIDQATPVQASLLCRAKGFTAA
jgi:hypothetical protein